MSVAIFWADKAEKLNQLAKVQMESANDMSPAVMLILAFYFAAPHMGDFAKAVIGRFQTKVK
jgi:hypothetical protein